MEGDMKQRKVKANKQIWKKIDTKTITLETTPQNRQRKGETTILYKRKKKCRQRKSQIVQNDIEYADDTQLLIGKDARGQMCERIGNYAISTGTRELKIQWKK